MNFWAFFYRHGLASRMRPVGGQRSFSTNHILKEITMNTPLFSIRFLNTITLTFVLLAAGVMTGTPGSASEMQAMQTSHDHIGPKGGDTRKGVYGVPTHLTGAVISLKYPTDKSRFLGPKGGDTRKGVYGIPAQLSGAVIPLTYPREKPSFIGPKGGDTRRGVYDVRSVNSGAIVPLIPR